MHHPTPIPPALASRHGGWRRLSEALLRTALVALLVGITVLAGAASQGQWSMRDVPWLREVTTHVGAVDPALAATATRPLPPDVALPATLRGPEAPDGMPMSAALDRSRIYATVDADEDGTRMLD